MTKSQVHPSKTRLLCLFESSPEKVRFLKHSQTAPLNDLGFGSPKVIHFGKMFTSHFYQNYKLGKLIVQLIVLCVSLLAILLLRPNCVVFGAPMKSFRLLFDLLSKLTQSKLYYFVAYQVCDLEIMTIYKNATVIVPTSIAPKFKAIGHTCVEYETQESDTQVVKNFEFEEFSNVVSGQEGRFFFVLDAYLTHNNVADRLPPTESPRSFWAS